MRGLFKLAVAVGLAIVAQVLVQPGGVGDELAFAARVAVRSNCFGIRPDAPEMLDAAARLFERQRHLSEALCKLRQHPLSIPEDEPVADAPDRPVGASGAWHEELACVR
jgi:hypothetical protein